MRIFEYATMAGCTVVFSFLVLQAVHSSAQAADSSTQPPKYSASQTCCPVVELRQYTLHPGQRDVLIDLFEREFVESQEADGMRLIGQFRDLDNSDRFVWLRGFADMPSRAVDLSSFYGGPVWKAHREQANATMVDSSNVLLLRPVEPGSEFPYDNSARPPVGTSRQPSSLVVATIYSLNSPVDESFIQFFQQKMRPLLISNGATPLATLQTETAENNFPKLPVRTGENTFVWFASFSSATEFAQHLARLEQSKSWTDTVVPELSKRLKSPPQELRLEPTSRSLLR